MEVCPTGAVYRDADEGLIMVRLDKCIACAMCAIVCPFDAVTFHPQVNGGAPRVVATKCDGCADRVRREAIPACADACKTDALVYGELNQLVKEGRVREAQVVLAAAVSLEPMASTAPETVTGWREWGSAATEVAGRAS
jgi:carbon-monoxide dehydrogenase iron sulfur subunit